jgi:hypothetical protein
MEAKKNPCTNHTSTGTPSSSETTVEKKKTNKRKETKEKFKNVQSSCMSVPYNPPRASYGLIHTLLGGGHSSRFNGRTLRDRHAGDETINELYYGLKNGL